MLGSSPRNITAITSYRLYCPVRRLDPIAGGHHRRSSDPPQSKQDGAIGTAMTATTITNKRLQHMEGDTQVCSV